MLEYYFDYFEQPVILVGDFNINFSLPEAQPLLDFLKDKFSFDIINGRNDATTKGVRTPFNVRSICKKPR